VLLFIDPALSAGRVLLLPLGAVAGLLLGDAPVEPLLAPASVFVLGLFARGVAVPLSVGLVVVLGVVVVFGD
jgi:hypothetical protein